MSCPNVCLNSFSKCQNSLVPHYLCKDLDGFLRTKKAYNNSITPYLPASGGNGSPAAVLDCCGCQEKLRGGLGPEVCDLVMLGGCCRGGSHLAAGGREVRLDCGCRIGDRSGSGRDFQQALGPTGSPEGRPVFQAPSGSFNARARHASQKGLLTGSPRSSCRDSV